MAYDEDLAGRLRASLEGMAGISEKRMMGGVCFFLDGNMIGGCDRAKTGERRFMFRVGKDNETKALKRKGAEIVSFNGRRMGGMIFVDEADCGDRAMGQWISLALSFVSTLPAK